MKNLTYGMIIILLAAALACQQKQTEPTASEEPALKKDDIAVDAISYDEAEKAMAKFKEASKKGWKSSDSVVRAFTIRSVDLFEAMGMKAKDSTLANYKHVRFYVGLDASNTFKLYLTPVEGANLDANPAIAGKDVILKGKYRGKYGAMADAEGNGAYMLDFSIPCPTVCPDN